MSTGPQSDHPMREHPSAYVVQDRSNVEEMARLEIQDQMLTTGMGGPLPELADPTTLRSILDVGCGSGGWLMEIAKMYPTIKRLVGVDISETILTYARAQAEAQHLHERVEFQAADALRALPFYGYGVFDLVNQRFGVSWLRTWEWKKILLEYQRVLRPGGTARITEMEGIIENNSPALTQLNEMSLDVFHHSGRFFASKTDGITSELARLLKQHGFEHIQTRLHTLVLRTGTDEGEQFYEDMAIGYRVALPFFMRWTNVPSNYQEIYQQALLEMQQPDFTATWRLLTVCGTKSEGGRHFLMRGLP